MILKEIEINNFRAIKKLRLDLDPKLNILHGANGHGKTSILKAIATGLGSILTLLPEIHGVSFLKSDLRTNAGTKLLLTTTEGLQWSRSRRQECRQTSPLKDLKSYLDQIVNADRDGQSASDLPIVAFYDANRNVLEAQIRKKRTRYEPPRYEALQGSLSSRSNFNQFLNWFSELEHKELREKSDRSDSNHSIKELSAVRRAIAKMLPGMCNPRIGWKPFGMMITERLDDRIAGEVSIDQIGGGYRTILALVADLVMRMVQGNPHKSDPLCSEAVVLIDEIDLHLHPSWQQRVLINLANTFPAAQFIVSTHSPNILATAHPHQIIKLIREGNEISAGHTQFATFGADSGDVMEGVMGVDGRSRHTEFGKTLETYEGLVREGSGRSPDAKKLRDSLKRLSPWDPALDATDREMRRQELFEPMVGKGTNEAN